MKHHRVFCSTFWCRHFHPISLLFLLFAFKISDLQAATTQEYIAWYWQDFPSGVGPTADQACIDLAAKMTALGFPRSFHAIVASPSEVSYPCSDDFLYVNYPVCELTSDGGPPSLYSCTDHAYVYSVVVNTPECSIHLSGPGGTNGALVDVEPGREVGGLRADVTCDGVPTSKEVVLTVKVDANTGGHNHVPSRPDGSLSPRDGSSPLTFSFVAPLPAGDHSITARCADNSCGLDTGKVWVGIHGLVNIPSSGFWNLYGDTGIHPAGHYLTGDAFGKLMDLAQLYTQVYFPLNTPVLQLNDASLVRGGVFDIDWVSRDAQGNIIARRTEWWTPPHKEHQRGVVIDIQANGSATAIPRRNFRDFEFLMRNRLGMTWLYHDGHYHVRLLGVAQ